MFLMAFILISIPFRYGIMSFLQENNIDGISCRFIEVISLFLLWYILRKMCENFSSKEAKNG